MDQNQSNWKIITLLVGAISGVALGLVAAYLFIQRAELNQNKPRLTAGEGVKVGMSVLGVLKMIADLGAGKK